MSLILSEIKVEHHRNGVAGNPFHVCLFKATEDGETRNHVAILFDDDASCAVLDTDLLAKGNIEFGDNSWRGDQFEPQLRKAIQKYHNE